MPTAKRAILVGWDGADPVKVWKYLNEGLLPNLAKVVARGVRAENMQGVHPTITPPNWASLATGAYPGTHGITCFWEHHGGEPLDQLHLGFDSKECLAEYIWDAAARAGKKSIVFNYPTGWPATSPDHQTVVDGAGVWLARRLAIDAERLVQGEQGNFQPEETYKLGHFNRDSNFAIASEAHQMAPDKADRARVPIGPARNWENLPESARPPLELSLPICRSRELRFGLLIDRGGNGYDTMLICSRRDGAQPLAEMTPGGWSEWVYDVYPDGEERVPVYLRYKLIALAADGSACHFYTSYAVSRVEDPRYFHPQGVWNDLIENVGPLHCYVGVPNDGIRLEVMTEIHDWYGRAAKYLALKNEWAILYMHAHGPDYANHNYINQADALGVNGEQWQHYENILRGYYVACDKMLGHFLDLADDETLLLVVSDHGAVTRAYDQPGLGQPHAVGGTILEEKGFLRYKTVDGQVQVDWENTRAICQRSSYVYVNLKGREPHGIVDPSEYEALVDELVELLHDYRDPKTGRKPVQLALRREDMPVLGLYGDRIGDIFFTVRPGWSRLHGGQLTTGKFGNTSVGCLFAMAGPGVKSGVTLKRPVKVVDVVPTICQAAGIPVPAHCEGAVLYQAFDGHPGL